MRLPSIEKGGVERLALPDIRSQSAEAKARVAAFDAFAVPTAKAFDRYTERENAREMQTAIASVIESDSAFVAKYKGQEEYKVAGVDDIQFLDLASKLGSDDPDDVIPEHKVYPEWRKQNYNNAVEIASSKIRSKRAREAFLREHDAMNNTQYAEDAVKATGQQIKYNAKQTMIAVGRAQVAGNHGGAADIINRSKMLSKEKAAALSENKKSEQFDYYKHSLEIQDLQKMKDDKATLINDDKNFMSHLDQTIQTAFVSQLTRAIYAQESGLRSANKAELKLTVEDSRRMMKTKDTGGDVNEEHYNENRSVIKADYPVLEREMGWTDEFAVSTHNILMNTPTNQGLTMRQMQDEISALAKDDKKVVKKQFELDMLKRGMKAQQLALKTDTMKYGAEHNLIKYEPFDFDNFVDSLKDRINPAMAMQDRFGIFKGFLTNAEMEEFGNRLQNAPNKAVWYEKINDALGDKAHSFYDQLKPYNVGSMAATAGEIASFGPEYLPIAKRVLEGERMQKEDEFTKLKVKDNKDAWEAHGVEHFRGIFGANPQQQSLMLEAFYCLMAVGGDVEENANAISGGIIDINHHKIQAPVRGMSGWDYKKYLKKLPVEWYAKEENLIYGFTPKQAKARIEEGDLIQVGLKSGESHLYNSKSERMTTMDGSTAFVYKFDKAAYENQGKIDYNDEWMKEGDEKIKKNKKDMKRADDILDRVGENMF